MGQTSQQQPWGGGMNQSPWGAGAQYNFSQRPNMWGGGQNMGGSMQSPMGGGMAPSFGGFGGGMNYGGMQKPMEQPIQQGTGPAPFTGDPGSYAAMQSMLQQQVPFGPIPGRNANANDVFQGYAPASTGAGHGFINPAYTAMNPLARQTNYPGFYPGVQR